MGKKSRQPRLLKSGSPPEKQPIAHSIPLYRREWFLFLFLLGVTLLCYSPAWKGFPIWDDDAHLTRPDLRSWAGLFRIWFELGATQQYYPLVHTVFWIEHSLWGDFFAGYHLVNVLLHIASAWFFFKILDHLKLPGAWLAAAIFALHPVHVESVAWITELKNTLSTVLCLAAGLSYLKFDQTRSGKFYVLAFAVFCAGLMCKSVIATLPPALLVIFWWQRRRLNFKHDVFPLAPFFLAGIASGLLTAWVERTFIGARGEDFNFTFIERGLIAGRSTWFYLGKLLLPLDLCFNYPRWNVSQSVVWQYFFPAAALLFLTAFWLLRSKTRGPLAALLLFGGTLFPVLGFLNVYPFRYSLVADHFQYLPSLSIIAAVACGVAIFFKEHGIWNRPPGNLCSALLLSFLWLLSWKQAQIYSGPEALWLDTLKKNPESWQAHDQLGNLYARQQKFDEAILHFNAVNVLRPQEPLGYFNCALALNIVGRPLEARAKFEEALRRDPDLLEAHIGLADFWSAQHEWFGAISHYTHALRLRSNDDNCRFKLASALMQSGRLDDAIFQFRRILRQQPGYSIARFQLVIALLEARRLEEVSPELLRIIGSDSSFIQAHPEIWKSLNNQPDIFRAPQVWREALDLGFRSPELFNNLAWILATHRDVNCRNGQESLQFAQRACALSGDPGPHLLDTLAAAYAEAGRFAEAVSTLEKAITISEAAQQKDFATRFRARLVLYKRNQPFRETL